MANAIIGNMLVNADWWSYPVICFCVNHRRLRWQTPKIIMPAAVALYPVTHHAMERSTAAGVTLGACRYGSDQGVVHDVTPGMFRCRAEVVGRQRYFPNQ